MVLEITIVVKVYRHIWNNARWWRRRWYGRKGDGGEERNMDVGMTRGGGGGDDTIKKIKKK
jgi:hypothetical protein